MLNCRLVVDVGSDFDSLNFAPFRLPYSAGLKYFHANVSRGGYPPSRGRIRDTSNSFWRLLWIIIKGSNRKPQH